jgi:hypothetical protein
MPQRADFAFFRDSTRIWEENTLEPQAEHQDSRAAGEKN